MVPGPARRVIYEASAWKVDLARRELLAHGEPVPIGARALEIIEVLLQASGELVSKEEIMARVWPGAIVEESTLQVHVSAIRKALGPDRGMLKTTSRRGYRLLGPWNVRHDDPPTPAVDPELAHTLAQSFQTNLPIAASELVGRDAAVQHLLDLLSAYRVVTLTGTGGIGKTVLALEVARRMFPTFKGDVWFVELVSLSDPRLVPSTLAGVVGLKVGGEVVAPEIVARSIGGKKLLFVLDGCEHVIDAAAKLAETLMQLCPRASVLATSREVLRIDGEYLYQVPALEVPPEHQAETDKVLRHSAVQLFLARTMALRQDYSPQGEDISVIGATCRRLDGIPLAIEFAAAGAAALGLHQVASRLDDRFALLTGGRRTALPRHRTLRATLDWSYDLLPEPEASLLRRLAVFVGDFSLNAAIAVACDIPAESIAEYIVNLVAKSLIVADLRDELTRYRLLDTTRLHALEKLRGSNEHREASHRHAEYYRDLLAKAEAESESMPQAGWLAIYRRHIGNVRVALDWAFSPEGDASMGVTLTAAAAVLWSQLSLMDECRRRGAQSLALIDNGTRVDARDLMKLYMAFAAASFLTDGPRPEVGVAWAGALKIAKELGDDDYRLRALWGIYAHNFINRDYHTASALAAEFREVALRMGRSNDAAKGDRLMGGPLHCLGDQIRARPHFERAIAGYRQPELGLNTVRYQYDERVNARSYLARILWLQGYADQSIELAVDAVNIAETLDHPTTLTFALVQAACPLALFVGDITAADQFVAQLLDLSIKHAMANWNSWAAAFAGLLSIRRGEIVNGAKMLREALSRHPAYWFQLHYFALLAELAAAEGAAGDPVLGLETIADALALAERTGERWCIAELLRVKGGLFLLKNSSGHEVAEAQFRLAQEWAKRQGALSFELRAMMSLAELRLQQGRGTEAQPLLAEVYDRFSEGFATGDLRAAKTLLHRLNQL
jgi:predicted ATPase/DNA-binding winged helix-turn-helix (wHTH) protein